MGILKDLENAADDIKNEVEKIGATIINDLEKVEQSIKDGIDKISNFLVKGFDEAEQKIIDDLKNDTLTKYADEITALTNLAKQGIAFADKNSIVDDVVAIVKSADSNAATAVLSNLVTTTMQAAYSEFSKFKTLSFGCNGEIDLLIGASAGATGGMSLDHLADVNKCRILVGFQATAGIEEGGDVGLCLGVWTGEPKDQTGGYIAVTLDADEGAGVGIVLYFSLSISPDFTGIVLNFNAGEEIEASVDCGFSLGLGVPKGTIMVLAGEGAV